MNKFHHELDSIYRNRIPDERVEWVFSTLSDIYKDLVVYRNELLRRKDQNNVSQHYKLTFLML